ncbi:MAG TPA: hypothetical protein VF532_20230, partial [Candidatus Angelobacter sp.]
TRDKEWDVFISHAFEERQKPGRNRRQTEHSLIPVRRKIGERFVGPQFLLESARTEEIDSRGEPFLFQFLEPPGEKTALRFPPIFFLTIFDLARHKQGERLLIRSPGFRNPPQSAAQVGKEQPVRSKKLGTFPTVYETRLSV